MPDWNNRVRILCGNCDPASYNGGYGNNVVISHADGRLTRYAHNSKLLVKAGQQVEQGEPIALSGSTGRSTGPHVHFEIYINGSAVDPLQVHQQLMGRGHRLEIVVCCTNG